MGGQILSSIPPVSGGTWLQPAEQFIDFETGAPAKVRALVESARGQKDQLATLRKFYPDAEPFNAEGSFAGLLSGDNFIYTNPETGRKTVFNPQGLDFGDIAGASRGIMQGVGGALGAGLGGIGGGVVASPTVVGVPPGAAKGAIIGGALGSQIAGQAHDAMMRWIGTEDTRTVPEKAVEAALETTVEGLFAKAGVRVGDEVSKFVRRTVPKLRANLRSALTPGNRLSRETAPELYSIAKRLNMEPGALIGEISGSKMVQSALEAVKSVPLASGVIDRTRRQQAEEFQRAATDVASQVAGVPAEQLEPKEGVGQLVATAGQDIAQAYNRLRREKEKDLAEAFGDTRVVDVADRIPAKDDAAVDAPILQSVAPKRDFGKYGELRVSGKAVPQGKFQTVKTQSFEPDTQFTVVDISDLKTSHLDDFSRNPAYNQSLQPRDRGNVANQLQVERIVSEGIDPEQLAFSRRAADGAPIVDSSGMVESGNGRVMALRKAYKEGSGNIDQYRTFLNENANTFGLSVEEVSRLKNPVLVRVRRSDIPVADFAREANVSASAVLGNMERAVSDANRLTDISDLSIPPSGDVASPSVRKFVTRIARDIIPDNELGEFIGKDGALTTSGVRRIESMLQAKAFAGNETTLARLLESATPEIKNINKAYANASPKIAKYRTDQDNGDVFPFSVHDDLAEAANRIADVRGRGDQVADELQQLGLFGDDIPETVQMLMRALDHLQRSPVKMREMIESIYDRMEKLGSPQQGSLLGDDIDERTKDSIVSSVVKKYLSADEPLPDVVKSKKISASQKRRMRQERNRRIKAQKKREARAKKTAAVVESDTGSIDYVPPPEAEKVLPALMDLRSKLLARREGGAVGTDKDLKLINEILDNVTKLNLSGMRANRTKFNNVLNSIDITGYAGPSKDFLKRLRIAIKDDLYTFARAVGPDAEAKLLDIDKFIGIARRKGKGLVSFLDDIEKKATPEEVYTLMMKGAKEGGTRLRQIKKLLDPAEWKVISGSVLYMLGRANPGAQDVTGDLFSPATFLTNWNKLSKEAKEVLFDGESRKHIDDLVTMSAAHKDTFDIINNSNTSHIADIKRMLQGGIVTGGIGVSAGAVLGSFVSGLMAVLLPYGAARLFTSPKFAKWMVGRIKQIDALDARAEITGRTPDYQRVISAWLGQMGAVMQNDEIRNALAELQEDI